MLGGSTIDPHEALDLKRILIVEDEGIVALNMQHSLVRLGYDVVGIAGTSACTVLDCPIEGPYSFLQSKREVKVPTGSIH